MLKPLQDNIVLEVKTEDKVTESGILLTEAEPKKTNLAKVIAVGAGIISSQTGETIPVQVPVGATVLFNKFAGTEVKIKQNEYLVVKEADILAIIAE